MTPVLPSPDDMGLFLRRIGTEIRCHRKRLRLSQVQLASRANIDLRNFQDIESGKIPFKITTIYKIALALDITLTDLFHFRLTDFLTTTIPRSVILGHDTCIFTTEYWHGLLKQWEAIALAIAAYDINGIQIFANPEWKRQHSFTKAGHALRESLNPLHITTPYAHPYDILVKAIFGKVSAGEHQSAPLIVLLKCDEQIHLNKICWHSVKTTHGIYVIEVTWLLPSQIRTSQEC